MTDASKLLSKEQIEQIETCAREQGRKPAEVVEEAIGRYMALRRLARLSERIEGRAQAKNIRKRTCPIWFTNTAKRRAGDSARHRDANILVSAIAYQRGKPAELLRRALEGEINLTVSRSIIDEPLEVLERKFDAPPEDISEARTIIRARPGRSRLPCNLA